MNTDDRKWEIIESEYLIRRPWLTARRDRVKLPTGVEIPEYYILEYPDWVNVIAITQEGKFVLVRQYRHGIKETRYEICAGVCETGEEPLLSAQRELYEETGYGNGNWTKLMTVSANASTMTNITHCYLATEVERISTQHLEETEDLTVHLLSEEEIQKRVKELGRQIHDDYKDKDKIVMIGLLKGAIYFFTDLSLAIDLPLRIDFMVASSYGSGTETSGNVDIRLSCSENIEGCHVLLVDDIIDSGVTMEAITRLLMAQKPASVKKVALCDKPSRRVNKLNADYVGFEIPDEFVVGYGLDYAGDYRNLPFIGVLKPEAYAK